MSDYSVIHGEVVYQKTGKKVRGEFIIKYGKKRTTIYKVTKSHPEGKFFATAKKMNKTTYAKAEKLYNTRQVRASNKALVKSGLTKYAKDEYERKMIQKNQTDTESDEPLIQREQDDYKQEIKKGRDKLSRESVRAIGTAKRQTQDLHGMFSKDTQNMINFERILTAMENDGTLSLEKINKMIESKNFANSDFLESSDEILGSLADFMNLLPDKKFENVSDFAMWLFVKYRDSDRNTRTSLWSLLHSFYPEQGYTYDPLSV